MIYLLTFQFVWISIVLLIANKRINWVQKELEKINQQINSLAQKDNKNLIMQNNEVIIITESIEISELSKSGVLDQILQSLINKISGVPFGADYVFLPFSEKKIRESGGEIITHTFWRSIQKKNTPVTIQILKKTFADINRAEFSINYTL